MDNNPTYEELVFRVKELEIENVKWKSLFQNTPNFITIVNRNHLIEDINHPVLGIELKDVIGFSVYKFIDSDYHDVARKMIEKVFDTARPCSYESFASGPEGELAYYDNRLGPIIVGGEIIAVSIFGIDITNRKRMEAEIKESQKLYNNLVETAHDLIWRCDDQGRYVYLNNACERIFGYRPDEMLGKPFSDFMDKETAEKDQKMFKSLLEEVGVVSGYETTHLRKDGSPVHLLFNSKIYQNEQGDVLGTQGTAQDITSRKQAEEEVLLSEENYRFQFLNMNSYNSLYEVVRDKDGRPYDFRFIMVNHAYEEYVGIKASELIGKTLLEVYPETEQYWIDKMSEAVSTGLPIHFDSFSQVMNTYTEINLYIPKKGQLAMTTANINERKRAEEALRDEKERLMVTLRSIGDGVITTDIGGRVIVINKVAEKLTGWSQSEATGKDIKEVFNIINAETRRQCENPIEKVLEKKTIVGLANHTNLIGRDGTERMIADSGAPIFDSNSEIIGVVLVFRDVTEKYKIEEQLRQSQKMEAIGTLAGGIAHDFNNMLGVITGNISYALNIVEKQDELYEVLSDVQESSKQAQNLTHQLLTFSKGGAPIKKVSNINQLINESAIFSARGSKVNCRFELSNELYFSDVDEGQINQVISNLIINANQAMPNGGTITIRTENTEIETDSGTPLSAGRYIKIVVEDQGIGISKKHLPNIFEPYYTTKQKGSGLGLATAYSIIKRHGGQITVYSEIDKGTVFSIYLPASSEDVTALKDKEEQIHSGQGKILIMDDQESILKMICRLLNKMGYEVASATDGTQAIEIYRDAYKSQNPFDLVILDLTVPGGMGGAETIPEILKIDPKVRAIVSSGYSNDPIMGNFEDYGFCGVVPKPYTKDQLAEVLNKIFGKND